MKWLRRITQTGDYFDLYMLRTEGINFTFDAADGDGTAVSFADSVLTCHVRTAPGADGDPLIEVTSEDAGPNGSTIDVIDEDAGEASLVVDELDIIAAYDATAENTESIALYYDVLLSPVSGEDLVLFEGTIHIKHGVTDPA